jgi:nucleotide-binding universal stress UspA family protein
VSYATLMVHVDAEGELGGRVKVAAELAERFRAHLIGVAAWAPMSLFLSGQRVTDPAPTQPHLRDTMSLLDLKGRDFRAAVDNDDGRNAEWRSILDVPTEAVAREARAADLVIIGNARGSNNPFLALDPGSLILKAGRPVLVVPNSVSSLAAKRIAIAWKDVREARRAVQDALPFLQQAESVLIVEVSEGDEGAQALRRVRDVAAYLARHRIEVITERVRPDEIGATNSLLRLIHDEHINLIVAGAYGHSRVGEWAYGGATRGLLTESPICCLFSH